MICALTRYPANKDSGVAWLGEVPAHWEVRRLKNVFRRILGGSTPKSGEPSFWDGEVVWVTPADVSRNSRLSDSQRKITWAGLRSCSTEIVPKGSLVVTSRAPVGNVSLADVELCTNQGCKALVPNTQLIESMFALHALATMSAELRSLASGTTFTEISTTALAAVPTVIPPLEEQVAIVRFLDHVDRRIRRYIRAKKKLVALLNEQKQAIIHRAVTRGLDPNVHLKPSGVEWLGDVPEHWEVKRAKYLYREVDERSSTGGEELLSVSHLTGVTPRSEKNITMFRAESYVGHKLCRPGDLVINTMWAWMGALGVSRTVGLVSPAYGVYRPTSSSELEPVFADRLLRTSPFVDEYTCRSTGIRSSRLRLYPDVFLRIRVPCPPREEQLKILSHIEQLTEKISRAIAVEQNEIGFLHEYRTRLIADVVTGKLDVREAAARLPEEPVEALDDEEEASDEVVDTAVDDDELEGDDREEAVG